jgi:hypothetical protein
VIRTHFFEMTGCDTSNRRGAFQKEEMQSPCCVYLELLEWTEIFVAAPLHKYGPT